MLEENKAIVRRWVKEAINKGNLAVVDEIIASDYVFHSPGWDASGCEEIKQVITRFRSAFPDVNLTIEDLIAEGDKVVWRWLCRGTHRGEFMGIAPTGKQATWTGIVISRFEDSKMVEGWEDWDALGMMQQLGVVTLSQAK